MVSLHHRQYFFLQLLHPPHDIFLLTILHLLLGLVPARYRGIRFVGEVGAVVGVDCSPQFAVVLLPSLLVGLVVVSIVVRRAVEGGLLDLGLLELGDVSGLLFYPRVSLLASRIEA